MENYSKDDFKDMINDFLADHAAEDKNDPLIIGDPEQDAEGRWTCAADDSKVSYELSDDGYGNIIINYSGTK